MDPVRPRSLSMEEQWRISFFLTVRDLFFLKTFEHI